MACDFSYHSTGIALLHYDAETRKPSLVYAYHIPVAKNLGVPAGLSRLQDHLAEIISSKPVQVYLRERVFAGHYADADRLFRVAGVADVTLWQIKNSIFYEYSASTIKKEIAGHGSASKEQVARALPKYVGEHKYATDDESDAVAVGLTFLKKEGYIDDIPND